MALATGAARRGGSLKVRAASRAAIVQAWRLLRRGPSTRWGAVIVGLAFVLSSIWYSARGIRFDISTLPYFDQLLDPILLRTRLWQSLYYLHGQPPLFNLLAGVALKLEPDLPQLLLKPVFLLAGLYTGLCLYFTLVRLRVPVAIGASIACLAVSSPAFVLHENWFFYPHLNVAWLLGAFAWLAQSRGRPGLEMSLAASHWAGLCLTRSLFHPLYFLLTAGLVVWRVAPGARRKAALCFLVPGLLLGGWCAKNQALFGFFGTSSWGSRNLSHAVETLVGKNRVRAEARAGRLSPAIKVGPFATGTRNVKAFGLTPRETGIPALDQVDKQIRSHHSLSYNHWSYPASAHFYAEDARELISAYPVTYLTGLYQQSLPFFLLPVDADGFLSPNREAIAKEVQVFDALDGSLAFDVVIGVGLGLALLASLDLVTARGERIVLSAGLLTVVWVISVGLVGELGENNRFRFKIVWLSWALAAAGYAAAARAGRVFFDESLLGHCQRGVALLRDKGRLILGRAAQPRESER
ncbi:MAG: hypothetical protein WDO74_23870 [Pseudomonadota bacterium]